VKRLVDELCFGGVMRFFLTVYACLLLVPGVTHAQEPTHGLSLFGAPNLGKDFTHYPYVNPDAPKGGALRVAAIGSFDSLNNFTIKGSAASGLGMIYDTLMDTSLDEPSTAYGLIAETVSHPADYSSVTFVLRKQARFHDGTPVRAEDVAFSLEALRAANPFYRAYYRDVAGTDILGPHEIRIRFAASGNRELPLILGQLPVLPKAYWTRDDRALEETTLDPPMGSGPYTIERVNAGRSITYKRNENYWARDLNVVQGRFNFERVRYEYFGDDTIAFEALKAGDVDYRREFSSRIWATGYDIDAVAQNRLKLETVAQKNGKGMQAFIFNTRRSPFDNALVREALNWAYDFEWTNKNLFYGQYARTGSFFEGSELAATGTPSAAELAFLEPLRGQIPDKTFGARIENPVTDGSGNIRAHLRKARALLEQAGWKIDAGKLKRDGTLFEMEFLLVQPAFERIVAPYIRNLERLGITARTRIIDPTQYQNRLNNYDFDAVVASFGQSLSPGNEQRDYWSSQSADTRGGKNLIGIRDPAVDSLVEKLIFATSRQELVAATRALDRVLLSNHYVVPQWHAPHERLAFWDKLAHPARMPGLALGFPDLWWHVGATGPGN
jgi:microcin C transport system substrate-binding protein